MQKDVPNEVLALQGVENYLLKEYEKAGVEPDFTYFYDLKVIIPLSYQKEYGDKYIDRFVDDFFDLHDGAVLDTFEDYAKAGKDEEFINIEEIEVPLPLAYHDERIPYKLQQMLVLADCYDRYKKSVVMTSILNKDGKDRKVKVGYENLLNLWEEHEEAKAKVESKPKTQEEIIKEKLAKINARVEVKPSIEKKENHPQAKKLENKADVFKNLPIKQTVGIAASILLLANVLSNKEKKASEERDSFSSAEVEAITTGNFDNLVSEYHEDETYEITPVAKEESKKAETKKEEAKVEKKKEHKKVAEVQKTQEEAPKSRTLENLTLESLKAPILALKAVASINLDNIKIISPQQALEERNSRLISHVLDVEGEYGTTAKKIKDAKDKIVKLQKAGKTIDKETMMVAKANVIDQETNHGIINNTLSDFHKKYSKQSKGIPKKVIDLSKEDAKKIIQIMYIDHYNIDKVKDEKAATLMLDIAYNHSSKTRYKVVSKGLDKVADKYDLDRPDSWSKKIDFLNDCNQKQLSEAGLEILKARKESVKGHKFENGLLNRYNKMDELFKDNKDIQLANQGKSSKTKG